MHLFLSLGFYLSLSQNWTTITISFFFNVHVIVRVWDASKFFHKRLIFNFFLLLLVLLICYSWSFFSLTCLVLILALVSNRLPINLTYSFLHWFNVFGHCHENRLHILASHSIFNQLKTNQMHAAHSFLFVFSLFYNISLFLYHCRGWLSTSQSVVTPWCFLVYSYLVIDLSVKGAPNAN